MVAGRKVVGVLIVSHRYKLLFIAKPEFSSGFFINLGVQKR